MYTKNCIDKEENNDKSLFSVCKYVQTLKVLLT